MGLSCCKGRSSAGKYAVRDEYKNRQKIDTTVEIHDVENREEHVDPPIWTTMEEYGTKETHVVMYNQTPQSDLPVSMNDHAFECPICMEFIPQGSGLSLRQCLHSICIECLSSHIKLGLEAVVPCPFMDEEGNSCDMLLLHQEIQALLTQEDFDNFLNRTLRIAENQATNSVHCMTSNCPGWCLLEDETNSYTCEYCHMYNCLNCQCIHQGQNCTEYQEELAIASALKKDLTSSQRTKNRLQEMLKKGNALHCPGCKVIVTKHEGCDWLRCPMCKIEICWATRGPRWGPKGNGDTSGGCKCTKEKKCHPKCGYCH